MNKKEMLELKEREKGQPIKTRIFKHKETGEYETQIDILEMNNYEEVK